MCLVAGSTIILGSQGAFHLVRTHLGEGVWVCGCVCGGGGGGGGGSIAYYIQKGGGWVQIA